MVRAPLRPRRRLAGGQRAGEPGGVRGRTCLHRLWPGAKEGLGTEGGGPRGFPRDPQRHRDGGVAASRLLPRFHRALPSARGGRQPCAFPRPLPLRVRGFSGAGDPARCLGGRGGSRLRGARASNPGLPEAGACPGAAEPARLFAGGREGGSGRCPLNSGKPAIAEVGRAGRPFFQEWVETFGAYSPGALQTQARVPSSRLGWLTKPNSRPRGDPVARGPEPALCRRGGWSRARHPPRPGPPPATPPPSSTLGTSVGRNNLFLETAAMKLFVTREGRVQSYKLLEGRTGFFPLGSLPAAVSRGACGTK